MEAQKKTYLAHRNYDDDLDDSKPAKEDGWMYGWKAINKSSIKAFI